MIKRFKNRKNNFFKIKVFLFIILIIISFFISYNYLYKKLQSKVKTEDIINYLLYGDSSADYENIYNLNSTEFLLKYSLGISINKKEDISHELLGDFIEDPSQVEVNSPIVYIYNTHQSESYNKDIITSYNISPTVMLTSYMLREKLNDLGIPTLVETTNISDVLKEHNWNYKDSYKASRILLERASKNYPSLKIFIDIHRDSSLYEKTTLKNDDVAYAKILFVVGLDYQDYEKNINNAERLNNIINDNIPGLTRGIMKKSGANVNGIYNQDFKNNTFLIEVGGQYNFIEEVKNTIDPLSKAIFSYIKELDYDKKA